MKANITTQEITNELYNIFSDDRTAAQYSADRMGAQYIGLCGWAGPMSPANRAAFLETFGREVVEQCEAVARQRVADYRAAVAASVYCRHEQAAQAHGAAVPNVGEFVKCLPCWIKAEEGPLGVLRDIARDQMEGEDMSACRVVEIVARYDVPEGGEFLTSATAQAAASPEAGGSRYEETDPLTLRGLPMSWGVGAVVVCGSRWYVVDSQGFNWARYIHYPASVADMFGEELAKCRRILEDEKRAKEEEAQRAKAARLAEYLKRCQRWEGAGLVDVRPLDEAAAAASKLHGYRSAEAKSAQRKADSARRRNILTMCQTAAPGVKFSVKKWDGWGGSYSVEWTDGPTDDHLKAAADLDLLEKGRDTFNGMDDSTGHEWAEFQDFAAQYLGVFGEINTNRHESDDFRGEIIARMIEAAPGVPTSGRVDDWAQVSAICGAFPHVHTSTLADYLERWGVNDAAALVARQTDRPTAAPTPAPTPDGEGSGATYGEREKSQNEDAPEGLELVELGGGAVAVVGDSRTTYRHRKEIKSHGAQWNKEAKQWEAHTPEAVAALREWLGAPQVGDTLTDDTPAPVADDAPTVGAQRVASDIQAYGEREKSQNPAPVVDATPTGEAVDEWGRTPETVATNSALVIVDTLRGFNFRNDAGEFVECVGPALLHPSRGFVCMPDDGGTPYTPAGGISALRSILEAGGFLSFDGFRFVWPEGHTAESVARALLPSGAVVAYGEREKSQAPAVYRVDDTETGTAVIYEGEDLAEAVAAVREDMGSPDPLGVDLYRGGVRIWCSKTDTGAELSAVLAYFTTPTDPAPTPDGEGNGATYGTREKSQLQEAQGEEVRGWYMTLYPTDDMGADILEGVTFDDIMAHPWRIYAYIPGDSLIRERVFRETADRFGVDYSALYESWLNGAPTMGGGEQTAEDGTPSNTHGAAYGDGQKSHTPAPVAADAPTVGAQRVASDIQAYGEREESQNLRSKDVRECNPQPTGEAVEYCRGMLWNPDDTAASERAARTLIRRGVEWDELAALNFGTLDLVAVWAEEQRAKNARTRLEEIRAVIESPKGISYSVIRELMTLRPFILPTDTQLLLWAGVPPHCMGDNYAAYLRSEELISESVA